MDRFAALEAFVRVAETRSFSEAARMLDLSPSVISKRIVDLERDLGAALFRRTTRHVSLTEAGEILLPGAGTALAALDDARRALGQAVASPRGRLRISAPTSFGSLVLAPAVCAFRERHPQVRVELVLVDRAVNPAAEGFDLAVDDSGRPPDGAVARPLAPMRRLAVAAPAYLARRGVPRTPKDLARHDCIQYSELESGARWRFRGAGGNASDVRVHAVLATNNGRVMLDAAVAGQGVAVLPDFLAADALADGRLERVLERWQVPHVPLALVHPRSAYTPLRARLLRDHLIDCFAARRRSA